MAVPNIFGTATVAIPLSQLDTNFATAITLGNTAVYLGNTTTSFGNVTLTNVTISSGNVTVSAGSNTSPSITTVGDTNTGIFFPAADTIAFAEGGVEAARIDSSGNLLVGNTSVASNVGAGFIKDAEYNGWYTVANHPTGVLNGYPYAYFFYNSSLIGSITQAGTTGVLYNVTSDQRLKENIVDADDASSLIDALQVRQFDWKSDNSHQRYGFIAQELVSVAPEAVHQPVNEKDMMAVDYSKLVPMLVKEIQDLRKRLADAGI